MFISLKIVGLLIPTQVTSRLWAILITCFYALIGMIIYFCCTYKSGMIYSIFGPKMIENIRSRIPMFQKAKKEL